MEIIEGSGANEQSVAASAPSSETAGANVQEVAAPADTNENSANTTPDASAQGQDVTAPRTGVTKTKHTQTDEENSKFAEYRRRQEEQLKRWQETERKRIEAAADAAILSLGIKNPATGKPFASAKEVKEYQESLNKKALSESLSKLGLSEGALEELIKAQVETHPDVVAARKAVEELKLSKQAAEDAKALATVEAQIKEIAEKYDPSIKSTADIMRLPEYPKIYGYVQKGLSITDAYRLVYADTIAEKKAAAAKQQVINDAAGKAHLRITEQRGDGDVTIPRKTLELYKHMLGYTEAQAKEHYKKYQKLSE